MLSTIIKLLILVAILGGIAFVLGPCVYYNFIEKTGSSQLEMPDEEEAAYSFYLENSRGLILANDYEQHGQAVGFRIFILHGFWEVRGSEFKFVAGDIILDEAIFGVITVKRRTK